MWFFVEFWRDVFGAVDEWCPEGNTAAVADEDGEVAYFEVLSESLYEATFVFFAVERSGGVADVVLVVTHAGAVFRTARELLAEPMRILSFLPWCVGGCDARPHVGVRSGDVPQRTY